MSAPSPTDRRRRVTAGQVVPPVILLVSVLVAWDLLVRFEVVSTFILPPPLEVWDSLIGLLPTSLLWTNAGLTMYETLAGFAVGSGLAFVLAVASSLWPYFRKMVYPYMIALQVTPRIAVTPVIIAWLGFGATPKIVIAATICFFPVYINTLTGMMSVDEDAREMFRALRASRWQTFTQLMLPAALPVTFAGLKTGMTLALIGAIVAEFVSAQAGMGLLIQQFSFQLNMAAAFAVLLMLTAIGLVLFAVMEYLDRQLVFWAHEDRLAKKSVKKQEAAGLRHDARPTPSREAA
ncbi:ABC transporter permease [Euzebya sp.]|uniref:ABC transporter permease n=1 Tax=Euzebya sp. TaxID=1971409 RepID=UPI0035184993